MDFFDIMFARSAAGGGGGGTPEETVTYDGAPPLDFDSNGKPATAYSVIGNMTQSSEPSRITPSYPLEFGDLVEGGEHGGEYAIPMTVGGTTQTIYLSQPLRKFDANRYDILDSDGTVKRRLVRLVLDGTESWSYTAGMHKLPIDNGDYVKYLRELEVIAVCSHYVPKANQASPSLQDGEMTFLVSGSGTNNMYIRDTNCADSTAFKAYLAAQYAAGTPVIVLYLRAEEDTSTVDVPTLTPSKGSNTLTFGTTLQPSFCSITCTIGGGGGSTSANKVSYDSTASGLSATNVQGALDEIAEDQGNRIRSLYGKGFEKATGDLADGDSLTLDSTNIKKNDVFSFLGKVTSFDKLLIGQGFETYSGAWVEITDTKLIVHNYAQSDTAVEYTHGLTISDYIYVQILVSVAKADIVIFSGGESFKQTNANWYGCNGELFAKSDGSTLTDCVFSWSCQDFRKSVWVFGDSYVGLNNVARWATQLRNAGFADNVLINGYAGEASSSAVTALTNALENYGQPKQLVWCLGMNDGADSGTTPSANYAAGIGQVEALCAEYGVELIRATIPTVPGQNNEGKNAYVRASGDRYIDFAAAVGASSSGVWYTDMLSTDNVHPSETGAIALYHRAIADCPELTFKNP